MPKVIFLDLDDTLISAHGRPGEAWHAVLAEFAPQWAGDRLEAVHAGIIAATREIWSRPESHAYWRQRLGAARREIVARGFARAGLENAELAVKVADRFSAYRTEQMALFPGVHETLDSLRAAGLRLALVTNGSSESQRPKIARFDLG